MRNVNYLAWLLAAALILCHVAPSAAVSPSDRKDRSAKPITVKADHLQADNKGKKAVFTGQVVSRQEDITIYSDRLEIFYGETSDDVDKIIAIGNVRILQTNRVGTGGHALYENKLGKITLTVNPKVIQNNDSITGKKITYFIDEELSVVDSGDNTRVEAVIHPKPGSGPKKSDGGTQR
jgi:lipopolysaccharide export system protein LptA